MEELTVIRLGRSRYGPIWDLQKRFQAERMASLEGGEASPDRLLLVQHEPVFTWGRRAKPEHLGPGPDALARLGAEVFEVERGGDVTFHGPGQLVAYPVIYLGAARCGKDLHRYMRALEQVCIAVCDAYGVKAGREPGLTGVWVGRRKIAALGTRVSRWVTLHGLSFNVTDQPLEWFAHITPCGIKDRGVTSLQSELGQAPPMEEVEARLTQAFCDELGFVTSRSRASAATNPFSP